MLSMSLINTAILTSMHMKDTKHNQGGPFRRVLINKMVARSAPIFALLLIVAQVADSTVAPRGQRGINELPFNFGASLDMVGEFPLEEGNDSEFEVRAFEINLGGPIDPFFDFLVTVAWHDDEAELEEAWVGAILPYNFRLQAGRSLAPFGYLNRVHEHDFPQVDQPFVIEGLTTDHGLIGDGAHLEYLTPLLNPTLTLYAGAYDRIQHSVGRRIEGFPVILRAESFFDWEDGRQALLAGVSHLNSFGDKDLMEGRSLTDPRARGKIDHAFGVDLKYKWRPDGVTARGLTLGGEYLFFDYNRYDPHAINDPASDDFIADADPGSDAGFYLYSQWDFDRFWAVGYRFDRSDVLFSNLEEDSTLTGHSVYAQWLPTEFSRVRVQYQYRERGDEDEHFAFIQGTFFIGWHPPHRF